MTYYESAEGVSIGRQRVIAELAMHNQNVGDIEDFFKETGEDREDFDAQEVLDWLGY